MELEATSSEKDWEGAAGRSSVQLAVTDEAAVKGLQVSVEDTTNGAVAQLHAPLFPSSVGGPLKLTGNQQLKVWLLVLLVDPPLTPIARLACPLLPRCVLRH